MVTGKRLGHPVRCLKNIISREMGEMEYNSNITNAEIERHGAGALRRAAVEGDVVHGTVMSGQIAAIVKKEQSAAEIIREMFAEAETLLSEGRKWLR